MNASVLGKLCGKTKYFVATVLSALIVCDKIWTLGLGGSEMALTPMEQILAVWGVVLGIDGLEGAVASLQRPALVRVDTPTTSTPGASTPR